MLQNSDFCEDKQVKTYPAFITKQRKSLASDEYCYHMGIQINRLRKTETYGKMGVKVTENTVYNSTKG